jgi:hypothetical protein
MTKTCKNCKIEKDTIMFPINYKKNDKIFYRSVCKDCYRTKRKVYHKTYNKKYYLEKKLKLL